MGDDSHEEGTPGVRKTARADKAERPEATTSWLIPVVTAVLLVSAFCLYYFVYVGARREYLVNRNFRALAGLGTQLQIVVSTHGSILEFYADLDEQTGARARKPGSKNLAEFLLVRPEDVALNPDFREREARRDYLRYLAPAFDLQETPSHRDRGKISRLEVNRRDGRWELAFTALPHPGTKKLHVAYLELDTLLKPLADALPFDDILLVSERGAIVYQHKKAGPQFTTLAGLLQAQAGTGTTENKPPKAEGPVDGATSVLKTKPEGQAEEIPPIIANADPMWRSRTVHLTDIALAGTRYKLFLQPILVDTFSDAPGENEPAREWVLCGLRTSSALEWESLSISYSIIIWFTSLFFVISMSSPILKIVFMNQREHLRLREFALLGLFLILLTGVFTLTGLQAIQVPLNDDTDEQLKLIGTKLAGNIHQELTQMRDQLVAWCKRDHMLAEDFRTAGAPGKTPAVTAEVIRNVPTEGGSTLGHPPPGRTPAAEIFPYLNNAFWTDDDGNQIVKWSTSAYVTPMIDVSSLPIFNQSPTIYLDGKAPPIHFDSILPPNKLEYLAELSMTTCDCNRSLCEKNAGGPIRGDISSGVAFLTGQPPSLIDPILPFGYGFALVDQTGMVLFHADKTRNHRENFRQESEWSKELLAATFGHATDSSLPLKYLGKDYRARVVPVPGVSQAPFSLIVFRDVDSARTENLQAVTMAATMLLCLLAGPVVLLAIWCGVHRPKFAPEWVWPNPRRMGTYLYQIAVYTLLIILFVTLGFRGSAEQAVIACAVVPYTALLLTFWCFRIYAPIEKKRKGGERRRKLGSPIALSALCAILFVTALVLQWGHWGALGLLPVSVLIAAVPLLKGPRSHVMRWVDQQQQLQQADVPSEEKFLNYRVCYVASALLLLLLTGVLTPMALFHASRSIERRLAIKQSQLHLAADLAERRRERLEDCKERNDDDLACAEFRNNRSPVWREMVLDPLLEPAGSSHGPSDKAPPGIWQFGGHSTKVAHDEFFRPWLQRLIYWLHHDYNDAAAETLGVIGDRVRTALDGGHREWSWDESSSEITLRWHGVHPLPGPGGLEPDSEDDLLIASAIPHAWGKNVASGVTVIACVMLLAGGLLWVIAHKIFLFHIRPLKMTGGRQAAESIRNGHNVLILLPERSNWQVDAPKWTMEIAERAVASNWAEALNLAELPLHTVIEIRRFEHETGNAETDSQKSVLLQRLLRREHTQVVVVLRVPGSATDFRRMYPDLEVIDLREEPLCWLQQYEGPARDRIWKECSPLPALWPIGAQLAADIRKENAQSSDTVWAEILERADAYYRLIWKECTKEQKFALAQLAEDGLLNPTNGRAILQMVRRGLILQHPQYRIMNESFRYFVRAAATAELKRDWIQESRRSGWGKVNGVFLTTMILLGGFLLTTQNALWESSAAYVTAAFGALGTLSKLLNTIRGASPTATPEKAG